MIVHVIMSNDYPDAVFLKETDADSYVARKNEQDKVLAEEQRRGRIFYRSYSFNVKESL